MATAIYFVLDRSGSMYSCVTDTIGGFSSFVDKQKQDNPDGTMSLFLFNDTVDNIYKNKPIKDVEKLTNESYFPAGSTSLCDAIGKTIKFAEKDTQNENKIIVILTDGFENTSKKYTKAHINDLIDHHKSKWQFVFLAANQDAIQTAYGFGIAPASAMTFGQQQVGEAFEGLSAAIGRQVTGESQTVEFSGLERARSCAPAVSGSPQKGLARSPNGTGEFFY
jgi:uncharacterized protein YegL